MPLCGLPVDRILSARHEAFELYMLSLNPLCPSFSHYLASQFDHHISLHLPFPQVPFPQVPGPYCPLHFVAIGRQLATSVAPTFWEFLGRHVPTYCGWLAPPMFAILWPPAYPNSSPFLLLIGRHLMVFLPLA